MSKVCYVEQSFHKKSLDLIAHANSILESYQRRGFMPTLRQLYYALVTQNIIANKTTEYDNLGKLCNNARLAGLMDWNHLEDRVRQLQGWHHDDSPEDAIKETARSYNLEKWENQENYIEVWIEKDALSEVAEKACQKVDLNFMACRGYMSVSEMYAAAQRLQWGAGYKKNCVIIHLGDHDPSGIDMTRDIEDRLNILGVYPEVRRIALNMDQVEEYGPPSNPAKVNDSRFAKYMQEFGDESWELDALEPEVLIQMIVDTVLEYRDEEKLQEVLDRQTEEQQQMDTIAENYDAIVEQFCGDE